MFLYIGLLKTVVSCVVCYKSIPGTSASTFCVSFNGPGPGPDDITVSVTV